MATITFDTYKAVTSLKSRGFSEDQAKGMIETLQEIDMSEFASKEDLNDLRLDMYKAMAAQTILIVGLIATLMQVMR